MQIQNVNNINFQATRVLTARSVKPTKSELIEVFRLNLKEDIDFIKKCAKSNINKNFVYNSIGLVLSSFALGILIPKVQYLITKKLTKENEFPGLKEYK